jgi:pyridoxamine-phosphate oxidase
MNLGDLRNEYDYKALDESAVDKSPFQQFGLWLNECIDANMPEPTAMVLSTANKQMQVSSRVVLLKNFNENGFVFFTDYMSRKGHDLNENKNASLLFFWPAFFRQIRISGSVEKISVQESDAYFKSRPKASQISAAISAQSSEIENREQLELKWNELSQHETIHRPENWGGYCLNPYELEFWQGRKSRLHDRIVYELQSDKNWKIKRLAP